MLCCWMRCYSSHEGVAERRPRGAAHWIMITADRRTAFRRCVYNGEIRLISEHALIPMPKWSHIRCFPRSSGRRTYIPLPGV